MKTFILGLASFFTLATYADAALPPYYQSTKEFRALLDSNQLTNILGSGEAIRSITRDDKGFIIQTTKYKLRVDVVFDAMDHPGPAKFHLAFHSLEPLE